MKLLPAIPYRQPRAIPALLHWARRQIGRLLEWFIQGHREHQKMQRVQEYQAFIEQARADTDKITGCADGGGL